MRYYIPVGQSSKTKTQQELGFAKKRMELEGRQNRKPYTKAKFKKIFSSWHIYALSLLYV